MEAGAIGRPGSAPVDADAKVIASPATELWEILEAAYDRLGFNILDDIAFKAMVLARLIEPTSKADTVRVLKCLAEAFGSAYVPKRCVISALRGY